MRVRLRDLMLAVTLSAGVVPAEAQKATERFIPLGQSPGLSGRLTVIGTIESADPATRSLTLAVDGKRVTALVSARTRIWLDRSLLGRSNLDGSFDDLASGRRAEFRPFEAGGQEAEWVKVQVAP